MAAAALLAAGCTEDPDTGKPDDGTTEEPGTEDNTGLISLITISNDEGDEHYWGFTYDSQSRPVAVELNGTDCCGETFFHFYQIDYSDSHVKFYDDTLSIDLTLDASGKAVSGVYHEYYDEYGYPEESETALSFFYDSEDRLIREEGTDEYDYNYFTLKYTWDNGNMVNSYIDYYDVPFLYSEYAATGNRPIEEWISEDLIGITQTREYSSHVVAYEESSAEYLFDDKERLTDITKTVPNYMVYYTQDYTVTVMDPEGYVIQDGKKYYHYESVRYEYEEPVETDRESMDPDITYVSITY